MMKAVKNCVDHAGIPLEEALRMANLYPARLMGLNDRGAVRPGLKADLVVFDRNFKISLVLKNGSPV
jgi:N-acetylglucosamine-6-phosphate deacetylase